MIRSATTRGGGLNHLQEVVDELFRKQTSIWREEKRLGGTVFWREINPRGGVWVEEKERASNNRLYHRST